MAVEALIVSVLALLFTVASFWWIQARPGKLLAYEPSTWAAYLSRERSALRLPLVLHNTGAIALVVMELRVRFVRDGQTMMWEYTRTTVRPQSDDIQDARMPFSIAGGATRELVAEFRGDFPGKVPQGRPHGVVVEAHSSRAHGWRKILAFELRLENLVHPANYIVYTNEQNYLTDEDLAEGVRRRDAMRVQWGLPEMESKTD